VSGTFCISRLGFHDEERRYWVHPSAFDCFSIADDEGAIKPSESRPAEPVTH
jgi:hypothetical protein